MTRLIVLPFRVLRPEPDIDFLAFGLADAISSTLSGLPSLVVRSTAAALPFADAASDLSAIAQKLDVDVVLLGTLLCGPDQVRVTAQLVQAPSGTLMRAITAQARRGDIFQLQDELSRSIVDSLSLSLSVRDEDRMNRDAPRNAEAYEYYLRANANSLDANEWGTARDLYVRCLELDPQFAPAWARLGRVYRLLGKYGGDPDAPTNLQRAQDALKRALEINPDLSMAHNQLVAVDVEGGRARDAMVRLLGRVREHSSEPELFAGLVLVCRYCGLLEASAAAYERAHRLDPDTPTSVAHTFLMNAEYQRAMETDLSDPPYVKATALALTGRIDEGIAIVRSGLRPGLRKFLHDVLVAITAAFENNREVATAYIRSMAVSRFSDPEAFYYWAGSAARVGDLEGALDLLERAVNGGFHVPQAFINHPWFDPLRGNSDFNDLVHRAERLQHEHREAFRAADGPRILGVPNL